MNDNPLKYRAFISYSRTDAKHAVALQNRLERFVLPTALRIISPGIKMAPRPLRPIFRDEDELVPGQSLPARIRQGLLQSEYLIVLCSPAAAKSEWVRKEILEFAALHTPDNILAVVVDGEPDAALRGLDPAIESLPAPLRYELDLVSGTEDVGRTVVLTDRKAEPLWVDWRAQATKDRQSFIRIVAALLSLSSLDELVERDAAFRRRQRTIRWIFAIAVLAGLILAGVSVAWQARKGAMARSATLTHLAEKALDDSDIESAARYALLALRNADRSLTGFDPKPAEAALARAMLFSKRIGPVTRIGPPDWLYTLSRNGKVAVAMSPAGDIRLWDAVDIKPLGGELHSRAGAAAVALTADGARLAVVYPEQLRYRIDIWDVGTRRQIQTLVPEGPLSDPGVLEGSRTDVGAIAYSQDGRLLAVGSDTAQPRIDLWDMAAGRNIASVRSAASGGGYSSLAFSGTGRWLAAAAVYTAPRVYSIPDLAPIKRELGPPEVDRTVVAFGNDDVLSIGGETGELVEFIHLFDEMRRERRQFGEGGIESLSPDGMIEFSSGAVLLWPDSYPVLDFPSTIKLFPGGAPARLPDRRTVITLSKGELRKWRLFNAPERIALPVPPGSLASLSTRGGALIVSDDAGSVTEFDSDTFRLRRTISLPPEAGHLTDPKLAASDDGGVIAIAGEEGCWVIGRNARAASRLSVAKATDHVVAVSSDGRQIALATSSGPGQSRLTLWAEANAGQSGRQIRLSAAASDVAFTPDGGQVVVSLGETSPVIVDVTTGAVKPAPFPAIYQAYFSRDGSAVVDGDTSENIRAYDTRTGRKLRDVERWRYLGANEDPLVQRWAHGYSLWDAVQQSWMLADQGSDATPDLIVNWWIAKDRRHILGLDDNVVYRWPVGPALALHGSELIEEACRTLLSGRLSRLSEREIAASPELSFDQDKDACVSIRGK